MTLADLLRFNAKYDETGNLIKYTHFRFRDFFKTSKDLVSIQFKAIFRKSYQKIFHKYLVTPVSKQSTFLSYIFLQISHEISKKDTYDIFEKHMTLKECLS